MRSCRKRVFGFIHKWLWVTNREGISKCICIVVLDSSAPLWNLKNWKWENIIPKSRMYIVIYIQNTLFPPRRKVMGFLMSVIYRFLTELFLLFHSYVSGQVTAITMNVCYNFCRTRGKQIGNGELKIRMVAVFLFFS